MVYDGIILSLIIGFIRKGSLRGLATLKIKFGWVFPLLFIFEFAVFYLENKVAFLGDISNYLFIVVYVIGLLLIWVNRKEHSGFYLIFLGVLMNFLVMVFNGGRMPVSEEAARILDPSYIEALKQGLYAKHELLTKATHLPFLGDIIPLTKPYPREQVISIGDVIMNIGIFMFIQKLMVQTKKIDSSSKYALKSELIRKNSFEGGE